MEELKNATQDDAQAQDDLQADGYYGEDDLEMDELDLSFLDEDDADEGSDKDSADTAKKTDKAA